MHLQGEPARFHPTPLLFPVRSKGPQESDSAHSKIQVPLVAVGLTVNRRCDTRTQGVHRQAPLPVVSTLMAKGEVAEEGSRFVV